MFGLKLNIWVIFIHLKVVCRGSEAQVQVDENIKYLI